MLDGSSPKKKPFFQVGSTAIPSLRATFMTARHPQEQTCGDRSESMPVMP